MKPDSHLVLLCIFLVVFIIGLLFHKESFVSTQDISSNMMSNDYMNAVLADNKQKFFEPCSIKTNDGVNFQFQASDKVFSWYNSQKDPNSCSVDVSSEELDPQTVSCSTANKTMYDSSVVKSINWDDKIESGKRCIVTFYPNVSAEQLTKYLEKLPSFKKVLNDETSYVSAFSQSLKLLNWGNQVKVDIPSPFHDKLFKQPQGNMARTVCFWVKLWWTSPNWRLLGSVGHGDWWERKPAIYLSPGDDTWVHFTVNTTQDWQNVINSNMRIGTDYAFVTCRIYKASDGNYKMTAKIMKVGNTGSEQVEQQTVNITGYPKLIDELEVGNRYMMFGNDRSGYTTWDWRVYNRFLTDTELNAVKDTGKAKLLYQSTSGLQTPLMYFLNTHMNRDFKEDLITHQSNGNDIWNTVSNEGFAQAVEQGKVKYLCVPSKRDRIYKINRFTRNVYGSWTFTNLIDVDVTGKATGKPVSSDMLFNPANPDHWQNSFTKLVIGLPALPLNFTDGKWLSEIYPNSAP